MPVDINALEEWTVGDRMLHDMLRGMTPDRGAPGRVAARHAAAGPAGLAQGHRDPRSVRAARRRPHARYRNADAQAVRRRHRPGRGRRLTGTVSPVFGDRLVSVTYSKLDGRHLLESWIPLLALLAHDPGRDWSAVCIGRAKKGTTPRRRGWAGPTGPAVDVLRDLVAMYDAGRREPLPLPLKTSYAWAEARHSARRSRTGGGLSSGSPATAIPARTRSRHTCGRGVRAALALSRSRRRGPRTTYACRGCGCRCCEPSGRR